jgi:hypothetical protein
MNLPVQVELTVKHNDKILDGNILVKRLFLVKEININKLFLSNITKPGGTPVLESWLSCQKDIFLYNISICLPHCTFYLKIHEGYYTQEVNELWEKGYRIEYISDLNYPKERDHIFHDRYITTFQYIIKSPYDHNNMVVT